MSDLPIKVVVATQKSSDEYFDSTPGQALLKLSRLDEITIQVAEHNKLGLSALYNEVLDEHPDHILVFMHDDVHVWDLFMPEKLRVGHKTHNVLGLAGTTALRPISSSVPSAWHMLAAENSGSGLVYHQKKDEGRWPTVFGRAPLECKLMDGLFLSVRNDEEFRQSGVRWDEAFRFHHYDLAFCARACHAGLKLATADIICLHASRGESMYSEEWKTNDKRFMESYKDILNQI